MKDLLTEAYNENAEINSEEEDRVEDLVDQTNSFEELEALKEISLNPESAKDTPAETESQDELPVEESKQDEIKAVEPPAKQPEGDAKAEFKLTEEIIKQFPEEDQKILLNYKDQDVKGLLTSFVNKERLIGKKEAEKADLVKNRENIPPQPQTAEIENMKKQQINQLLKSEFPEFPANGTEEDIDEFVDSLGFRKGQRFLERERDVRTKIDHDFNTAIFVMNNHEDLNREYTNQATAGIKQVLNQWGINDPKSIGIDLDSKEFIESLRKSENGNYDPSIHAFFGKIPLLKPQDAVRKFTHDYASQIITKVRTDSEVKGRSEGFKSASDKKKEIAKSIGETSGKGQPIKLSLEDILKSNDTSVLEAVIH